MGVALCVGGHRLKVEGECAERFLRFYKGAQPFIVDCSDADWTVRYGIAFEPATDGETLNEFTFSEINADCRFRRCGDDYFYEMYDSASGSRLIAMRHRFGSDIVEATECSNESALRFSLWFALSMLSAASRLTFVHSSVIVHQGRAVLFLGEYDISNAAAIRIFKALGPMAVRLIKENPYILWFLP